MTDWAERFNRAGLPYLRWRELCVFGATPAHVSAIAPAGRPVYLATPYSLVAVDDAGIWSSRRSARAFASATREAGRLIERGVAVVSPISIVGVTIHLNRVRRWGLDLPDPLDGRTWGRWCWPLLDACGAVVVPDLPGVMESEGVLQEVVGAIERNKRVFFYQSLRP